MPSEDDIPNDLVPVETGTDPTSLQSVGSVPAAPAKPDRTMGVLPGLPPNIFKSPAAGQIVTAIYNELCAANPKLRDENRELQRELNEAKTAKALLKQQVKHLKREFSLRSLFGTAGLALITTALEFRAQPNLAWAMGIIGAVMTAVSYFAFRGRGEEIS